MHGASCRQLGPAGAITGLCNGRRRVRQAEFHFVSAGDICTYNCHIFDAEHVCFSAFLSGFSDGDVAVSSQCCLDRC